VDRTLESGSPTPKVSFGLVGVGLASGTTSFWGIG
jgi:hypothetical protein